MQLWGLYSLETESVMFTPPLLVKKLNEKAHAFGSICVYKWKWTLYQILILHPWFRSCKNNYCVIITIATNSTCWMNPIKWFVHNEMNLDKMIIFKCIICVLYHLWPTFLHLSLLNYCSADGTATAESQTQVISIKGHFLNEAWTVVICVME